MRKQSTYSNLFFLFKRGKTSIIFSMIVFFLVICSSVSFAQQSEIEKTLIERDSLFWITYNTCDLESMEDFIAEDLEFYHDKGGITLGKAALIESMANGLCKGGQNSIRREVVPGTQKVFQLQDNGKIYGVIMNGEHLFYPNIGKSAKPQGSAAYSNLWLLKDGQWKMHRVLSYDHQPVPKNGI